MKSEKLVYELLKEAIEYIEMASYADNSDGEYLPICQECGGCAGKHEPDCRIMKWLERTKRFLYGDDFLEE